MPKTFDVEKLLLHLSRAICLTPALRNDFEERYKTDKYRFYEKARNSRYYTSPLLSAGKLEYDVATKRIFGILLCSEEDEALRRFVCSKLLATDRSLREVYKKPTKKNMANFMLEMIRKKHSYTDIFPPGYFIIYLIYAKYGEDSDNEIVKRVLSQISKDKQPQADDADAPVETSPDKDVERVLIERNARLLINELRTGHEVSTLWEFLSNGMESEFVVTNPSFYDRLMQYKIQIADDEDDVIALYKALIIVDLFYTSLDENGFNFTAQYLFDRVTKEEQDNIIKVISENARYLSDCSEYADHYDVGYSLEKMDLSVYIAGFLFMLAAKEMKNMKDFYFRNNSETQFSELQHMDKIIQEKDAEINRLKEELAKAAAQNERQSEEIRQMKSEASKGNKEAVRPYASEISELNGKIKALESSLETERGKNPELNALREFAFSIQSGYTPPESSISLQELIEDKKIVVIGGYVNWRKKIKSQYPTLTVLDGRNASLDVSIFNNADFILINTSDMPHKVYYKIIDYVREKKIRFKQERKPRIAGS